ncbi:hypothetical protein LTR84_008141 [Exophiala bonariae]|uniref:Metallo-beta-lactamase domain-containing protein n=1 Tax=Exophiala bonariae TaxID=1690606 RepID=A0AAV9NMJ1_9EURO|nr:hypothetical protein LTR84_008141 [Exophiala bonariae]
MTSTVTKVEAKFAALVFNDYLVAQIGKVPDLPQVGNVTDRVVRILGGNPGKMQLQGTNTYLIGTGKSRILIDTGQGCHLWVESLVRHLEEHSLEIAHVLLTHWHKDHTGGLPDLVAQYPMLASQTYKNCPDLGQLPIKDGQTFSVEGATIEAVFTPGHAVDHMCFILREEQAMFTGDNVLGHGYTVIEDLGAYLTSLRYMEDQQCRAGYPGHGAKLDNLPSKIKSCINREELRLNQVYAILAEKTLSRTVYQRNRPSFTNRELVTFLYGEVSDALFDMALEPCMNRCLWKLAEDGKAAFKLIRAGRSWYARVMM